MLRTAGSGSSGPGTSKWVLWDVLEVTKGQRKAEQAGLRSTTYSNYRILRLTFFGGVSCTAPSAMRLLSLRILPLSCR